MITTEELKVKLAEYGTAVKDLEEALAIEASRKRVQELEHTMSRPGFYDDAELSKKVFDEVGDLRGKLNRFEKLQGLYDDAETMLEMLDEEYDPELIPEAEEAVNTVEKAVDELQLMTMLNGEYDHSNAILTFHAGTGGTEAQDWAEMLYRMYNRWAAAHGMTVEVLDYQDGDEAGLKSASMMVKGANAYGLLKSENGVHRLVRVSPFDANARRQTSFASLEVMPELDNTIQVDIRPEDIEMQVYRSSGAGGQHINKTSSAVRLIHKPTGIVVSCQTQRSQFQNRDYAMEMLKAKLYQIAQQQHMDGHQGRPERDRLGPPDPQLRLHALHHGQGPSHQLRDRQRGRCHGRRPRRLHLCIPQGRQPRGIAGHLNLTDKQKSHAKAWLFRLRVLRQIRQDVRPESLLLVHDGKCAVKKHLVDGSDDGAAEQQLLLPGVRGQVPDGVGQAEHIGQAVFHFLAEIVVGLRGRVVLALHFEEGVDVFHREHRFGDDDVDQAGQLLTGVFFLDGVADDPFLDVVAHHGSCELHPRKCTKIPVDVLDGLVEIQPDGRQFCVPRQGKIHGAGRNAAVGFIVHADSIAYFSGRVNRLMKTF